MNSCEFCDIFRNTFFTEQLWTNASEISPYINPNKAKKNIHRNRNITVQKYNKYGWDTQTSAIRKTNQEHPTKLDRDGPKK